MWHSDFEEWFAEELIYKSIIFDSDVKVKKSDICSFMLHIEIKLHRVSLKELKNLLPFSMAQNSSISLSVPWYSYAPDDPRQITFSAQFDSKR